MIVDVDEERLLITSDTHIGSFFCNARRGFAGFLEYACTHGWNVCINGDGIDVVHTSLRRITTEGMGMLRDLQHAAKSITIYYTVGNHDLILEHSIGEWGGLKLVPFLNVRSGPRRIRIEHGHLYDPFLINHPDLQHALTRFSGYLCRIYPPWYYWHEGYKIFRHKYVARLKGERNHGPAGAPTDNPRYLDAAEEVSERVFDAVIFGHTHHQAVLPLNRGRSTYYNTGSWFKQPYYLVLDRGELALKKWLGPPSGPPSVAEST
jgi:UDP-2,3-diacylglucosamine pyrophosphatase LpxH